MRLTIPTGPSSRLGSKKRKPGHDPNKRLYHVEYGVRANQMPRVRALRVSSGQATVEVPIPRQGVPFVDILRRCSYPSIMSWRQLLSFFLFFFPTGYRVILLLRDHFIRTSRFPSVLALRRKLTLLRKHGMHMHYGAMRKVSWELSFGFFKSLSSTFFP